jgi:hypothetical protein
MLSAEGGQDCGSLSRGMRTVDYYHYSTNRYKMKGTKLRAPESSLVALDDSRYTNHKLVGYPRVRTLVSVRPASSFRS